MKKIEVLKAGPYYNPYEKVTVYLEERVYNLADSFADLVVDEHGGDYTEEEVGDQSKGEYEGLDYSDYNLTAGALKLAVAKEVSYELMDEANVASTNGRITKEDLENALIDTIENAGIIQS